MTNKSETATVATQQFIGYDEAARITGIRRATLASMVCRRQIPYYRPTPRVTLFVADEIVKWMEATRQPPNEAIAASAKKRKAR